MFRVRGSGVVVGGEGKGALVAPKSFQLPNSQFFPNVGVVVAGLLLVTCEGTRGLSEFGGTAHRLDSTSFQQILEISEGLVLPVRWQVFGLFD